MIGYTLSDGPLSPDGHHLVLRVCVWAYGLQSSILFLDIVVLRVVMAVLGQGGYTTLARLLVVALEHVPDELNGENNGSEQDTNAIDESTVMAKL